jgi:hypothetical protein
MVSSTTESMLFISLSSVSTSPDPFSLEDSIADSIFLPVDLAMPARGQNLQDAIKKARSNTAANVMGTRNFFIFISEPLFF